MPIDYKKYPPDWKDIRKRILARANNRCEFCGIENNTVVASVIIGRRNLGFYDLKTIKRLRNAAVHEGYYPFNYKTVKVVLTIAHLDHDETNWAVSDDRLRALCQSCHLKYDAKEKVRRAKEKLSELVSSQQPLDAGINDIINRNFWKLI